MQKQMLIIGAVVALVVAGGIAVYTASQDEATTTNTPPLANAAASDRVEADGTIVKPDGTMVKPDGTMIKPDGTMVGPDGQIIVETNTNTANINTNSSNTNATNSNVNATAGNTNTVAAPTSAAAPATLVDYSAAALATAQAGSGATVLYFHADWCPVCRALEPDIQKNLSRLPQNLTILKVNYDREVALKKQYGVTYQHTFVQVNDTGAKLKLWSGSTNALDIADELI